MGQEGKKRPPLLVPDWLYTNGFTRLQRDVLCFVAMRGKCFQNKETMAQLLGCNRAALREALKELVVFGWLKHTKKDRSDCYQVNSEGKPIIRVEKAANKRAHSKSGAFEKAPNGALVKAPNGALVKAPNGATNYDYINYEDINYEAKAREEMLLYRRKL